MKKLNYCISMIVRNYFDKETAITEESVFYAVPIPIDCFVLSEKGEQYLEVQKTLLEERYKNEMRDRGRHLKLITNEMYNKIHELVSGVDVDLDKPLPDEDG